MFLLLVFHPLLRRLYESTRPIKSQVKSPLQKAYQKIQDRQADARLDQRVRFDVGFACIYLLALHGSSAFKVLTILYINFSLAKGLPKSYVPLATWVFNIGILFANELCKGYPYAAATLVLLPWSDASQSSSGGNTSLNWGSYLDSYGGLLPRWEILFNITVLRLISFNLDYCWSLDLTGGSLLEVSKALIVCNPRPWLLIVQRRSNSTSLTCRSENESIHPPRMGITLSETTLHMFSTRPFTLPDQF